MRRVGTVQSEWVMRGNRGKGWEARLNHQHREYRKASRALIFQAHPEVKVIDGRTVRSPGPPDYFGIIQSHGAVLFDAKESKTDRWPFAKLKDHQAKALEAWVVNGGTAGIALRTKSGAYWVDWRLLGPIWWRWREEKGSPASVSWDWLAIHAAEMDGADWLSALLGWRP